LLLIGASVCSLTYCSQCSILSLHDALPISELDVHLARLAEHALVGQPGNLAHGTAALGDHHVVLVNHVMDHGEVVGVAIVPLLTSEEHTSKLQSRKKIACRLLLQKKNNICL